MTRKSRKNKSEPDEEEHEKALRNPDVRVVYNHDGSFTTIDKTPSPTVKRRVDEKDYTDTIIRIFHDLEDWSKDQCLLFLNYAHVGHFTQFLQDYIPETVPIEYRTSQAVHQPKSEPTSDEWTVVKQ